MKNSVKVKVILLAFTAILATQAIADDSILPLPRPGVDEETKAKTAKKKEIYPQKKPENKKKKTEVATEQEVVEKVNDDALIFPKNK